MPWNCLSVWVIVGMIQGRIAASRCLLINSTADSLMECSCVVIGFCWTHTDATQHRTHRTEHPAEHTEMPRFVVVPSPPSSPQSTLLNQGSGILCWHQSLRQAYHPTTKQLILSNWPWTWLGRPGWVEQLHFPTWTQSTQNPFLEITSLPLAWKAFHPK